MQITNITRMVGFTIVTLALMLTTSVYAESSVTRIDVANWLIQDGVSAYHAVYGEWPASWAAVVEAGLVQVPLVGLSGDVIDPDDGQLDFDWDLQYIPAQDGSNPKLAIKLPDGARVDVRELSVGPSYAERFQSDTRPAIQQALSNEARLKQWAIGGMLQRSLSLYLALNGTLPSSFEELFSSGVTGVDAESINPLTGGVILDDGSPNNFKYVINVDEETCDVSAGVIFATDENGETPWKFST